jgi:hypothetical protein
MALVFGAALTAISPTKSWRDFDPCGSQVLAVAFENVPICTRTFRDAIRLAEHCHPVTRAPMAGCWFDLR